MTKIVISSPAKHEITLTPGKYKFECWGAQGGRGTQNGDITTEGGKGAYTSGILTLYSKSTFYCFVGGKGSDGNGAANYAAPGGFNGGGNGGVDTVDDDSSGAGAGATDIRTIDGDWNNENSLNSRIMVASGGSGSAYDCYGAPGGTKYGFAKSGKGIDEIETTEEYFKLGIGDSGKSSTSVPTSGAGSGYYGGISTSVKCEVATSGTSFVSGHEDCIKMAIVFQRAVMLGGNEEFDSPFEDTKETGHSGDGAIKITPLIDCTCKKSVIPLKFLFLGLFELLK